jgi:hypothetical protein
MRRGAPTGAAIIVRTSVNERSLPIAAQSERGYAAASLQANDSFLDAIAFSRGRIMVEMAGTPDLIIPAWPEPARVVEDCRS